MKFAKPYKEVRDEIGETVQAIGENADVNARASEKLTDGREAIKGSAADAKAQLV
jgi:hypothetical protein